MAAKPEDVARERAKLDARIKLYARAASMLGIGKKYSIGSVRAALPLIEAYAGRSTKDDGEEAERPGTLGFKRGEESVLKAAGVKMFLELLEVTSKTDPVYDDAPVYVRLDERGMTRAPHLVHLLALAAAAKRYFGDDEPAPPTEPPPPPVPEYQRVAYLTVAPGEYQATTGPLTPTVIRRSAMRERTYNEPQLLRYDVAATQRSVGQAHGAAHSAFRESAPARAPAARGGAPMAANGCGCGRGGTAACKCGGGTRDFPPARYKGDGSCESFFDISCETRWRVRECFKVAFCDLIRCFGDEMCDENGQIAPKPDFGACLERFVCSVLTCLPDAICPPPDCKPAACVTVSKACDDCNFAVGE
jgi:hypothetical protein